MIGESGFYLTAAEEFYGHNHFSVEEDRDSPIFQPIALNFGSQVAVFEAKGSALGGKRLVANQDLDGVEGISVCFQLLVAFGQKLDHHAQGGVTADDEGTIGVQ